MRCQSPGRARAFPGAEVGEEILRPYRKYFLQPTGEERSRESEKFLSKLILPSRWRKRTSRNDAQSFRQVSRLKSPTPVERIKKRFLGQVHPPVGVTAEKPGTPVSTELPLLPIAALAIKTPTRGQTNGAFT